MKANLLGLVPLSFLLLVGCATRPAPHPAETMPGATSAEGAKVKAIKELAGTSWVLVEIDGQAATPPPAGWSQLSLEFGREGLRATGNAGVNRFGGRYEQYDAELTFGPLALTRRIGPAELMEEERRYTHVLSRVVGWYQDGERLVLVTPGEKRAAVFERFKPETAK